MPTFDIKLPMPSKEKLTATLPTAIFLTLACVYSCFALHYTWNVPVYDEFRQTLAFQVDLNRLDWPDAIKYIMTSFHNGHHIPLLVGASWLSCILLGSVNFLLLSILGHSFLFLSIWIFSRCLTGRNSNPLAMSVFFIITLSFSAWENMQMGTQSFNFNLNLLGMAIFSHSIQNKRIITMIIGGTIACWTCANGLAVLPLSIALSLAQRTSWRKITVLATWSFLLLLLYYYAASSGMADNVNKMQKSYSDMAMYFMAAVGSWASFGNLAAAVTTGLIVVGWMLSAAIHHLVSLKNKSALLDDGATMIYLLMSTLLLIAYARSSLGYEQALSSRYSIYSAMIIGFYCYRLSCLDVSTATRWSFLSISVITYAAWTSIAVAPVKQRGAEMQKSHHNWGTRSPYYVHPGNDPILSRHAFEAWINDIYPGDGFFYLNHPPNSIATYAVETEGTFRQSIYLERPVSIKSFSVLVGTYGRRAHGNARLSIIKNGNVIYRSHYIPLASINDNTDLTFQGIETALPNGELDFSIEISDLSPGEKLTVWCSPPLWLYKRYSDPSGKSLDQLAMCCSLDLSSRH